MRIFSKKKSTFWTGVTGRAIRELKYPQNVLTFALADYLIGGPAANAFGLYQLDLETARKHLGITERDLLGSLVVLDRLDFARYDSVSCCAWVIEMARHQLPLPLHPRDKFVKAASDWYAAMPVNVWLGPFFDQYEFGLLFEAGARRPPRTAPAMGHPAAPMGHPDAEKPSVSVSVSPPLFPLEGGAGGNGAPAKPLRGAIAWQLPVFDRFWKLYPKPEGKKQAWETWRKLVTTEALALEIVAKLEALLPYFNYAEDSRFIPAAFRWLDRERWHDEPPKVVGMSGKTQTTAKAVHRAQERGAPEDLE